MKSRAGKVVLIVLIPNTDFEKQVTNSNLVFFLTQNFLHDAYEVLAQRIQDGRCYLLVMLLRSTGRITPKKYSIPIGR